MDTPSYENLYQAERARHCATIQRLARFQVMLERAERDRDLYKTKLAEAMQSPVIIRTEDLDEFVTAMVVEDERLNPDDHVTTEQCQAAAAKFMQLIARYVVDNAY